MPTTTRRSVLHAAVAASPVAAVAASKKISGSNSSAEVYTRLGVQPVINGVGTVTVLGGSIMPPEVVEAMTQAAGHFVSVPELQKKAGERIAELLKVPAAMVVCGAASGIAVATAACMSRGDREFLEKMPEVAGPAGRFEVIQQKSHRSGYEHQMRTQGARIVWVDTAEDVARVVSDKTAMMFFLNKNDGDGKIRWQEWVALAKKHNVPSFNDCAADVPPKENLWKYVHGGFDLVAFSGGKGLLGPQASGMLLGRKDLIDAAMPCISPAGGVGRGMKVGKEEIVGLVAAVERFLRVDHDAEFKMLDQRVADIKQSLVKVKGLKLTREVPEIANVVPHLRIEWSEGSTGLPAAREVVEKLKAGTPAIHVQMHGKGNLYISVWMMRGSEHQTVARRLREIFNA